MPTYSNLSIPFLGGGPTIAEQILEGLHQGFTEKQQQQELGLSKQRTASDVSLQSAQTDEIRERIRKQQVLSDMFKPKADEPGTTPSVSTDASGAPAAPTAPRSDFDRIVDQSDLPDSLKDSIKFNGKMQAQAGQPVKAFDFFQTVLDKFGRKITPHILSNGGIPYAVTDRFGEPWELHDPNMPDEMQPLAAAANKVFEQKNILPLMDVQNANAANARLFSVVNPGQPLPADLQLPSNASKDEAARVDRHLKDLLQAQSIKTQRDAANAARDAGRSDRE